MNIRNSTWRSVILFFAGAWVGILVLLAYGVAGTIFKNLDSKTIAGYINGLILVRMNHLEYLCAALIVLPSVLLYTRKKTLWPRVRLIVSGVMMVNLFCYADFITPQMNMLKEKIVDFDQYTKENDPRPERMEFDAWHRRYSELVGLNVLLALAVAGITMRERDE